MATTLPITVEISSLTPPVALDSYHMPLTKLLGLQANDLSTQQLLIGLQQALEGSFLDRTSAFMKYRGHALKRSKAFFVDSPEVTEDGAPELLYRYRYPGFQHESLLHYRALSSVPALERLVRQLAAGYTYQGRPLCFNHVIATLYRDGDDNIGWHGDKMPDITPGTPILSLSLGGARDLQLRPNPATTEPAVESTEEPVVTTSMLTHGDLFVLGPETNRLMQHRVPPATTSESAPRARISLVFRHIQTRVTRDDMLRTVARSRAQKDRKRARDEEAAAVAAAVDGVQPPPSQRARVDQI